MHKNLDEQRVVTLVQLYPRHMNLYGDDANVLVLRQRLTWRGFSVTVHAHHPGQPLPQRVDIVIGGGGQDSGQERVHRDLLEQAERIHQWVQEGVPMLMVCGLYQMFGRFFLSHRGVKLPGIEVFDAYTEASADRLVGNITIDSPFFSRPIVGYENHSGRTFLGPQLQHFGRVRQGAGNNGIDGTEGARVGEVFGTYLHGPLLPRNSEFADALIMTALRRRGLASELAPLSLPAEEAAYARALERQR